MKNQYVQGELETHLKESVNSLIMEIASDIADDKVMLNFGADAYITDENGDSVYAEDAQEVFNQYYDEEMNRLYSLVNEIKKLEEENI